MTSYKLTSGSVLVHVGVSAWSCCIFVLNFVQMSSFSTEILAFYEFNWTVTYLGLLSFSKRDSTWNANFFIPLPFTCTITWNSFDLFCQNYYVHSFFSRTLLHYVPLIIAWTVRLSFVTSLHHIYADFSAKFLHRLIA